MTRRLDFLSIFGPLQHWIFAQQHKKMTKVGSQFCQILNKVSRNCRTPIIFCQSGEISPNLVTLKRTNFFDLNDSHLAIGKITFQNELSLFRGDVVVVVAVVWTWNVICCLFLSLLKTKIIKKLLKSFYETRNGSCIIGWRTLLQYLSYQKPSQIRTKPVQT